MIPVTLTLSGFLSYRDSVTIDFTTFDLACISGQNGAGKSSLLDAITWALFGQARKRDEALIHSNPEVKAAEVTFIFEYEDSIYRVQRTMPRGKPTMLEFQIKQASTDGAPASWKTLSERTQRDTQASLEHMLRMDYDTFVNASFFLQGKADQFTQQRPGDRKRILSSILGLEAWEDYQKKAADRRKAFEDEVRNLEGSLKEIKAELDEESARKQRLQELESRLKTMSEARLSQETILENFRRIAATLAEQRRWVEERKRQAEGAQRRLEEQSVHLTARKDELAEFDRLVSQEVAIRAAYAAWQHSREELARWDEVAAQFRLHEQRRQEPLNEIRGAQAALFAEQGLLLGKQGEVEVLRTELPSFKSQVSAAQDRVTQADEKLKLKPILEIQQRNLQQRLADARAENTRLKIEMDELKIRIDQLQQVEGARCPLCGQPLAPEDRQRMVDSLQDQGKEMGDRFRNNKTLLDGADQIRQQYEAQLADLVQVEFGQRAASRTLEQFLARLQSLEAALTEWETTGSPRVIEIKRLLDGEDFCPEARMRLQEIDAELKAIGYDAAAHDAARLAESQQRQAEKQLIELEKALATQNLLEREVAGLEAQQATSQVECQRLQEESARAAAELDVAEAQAPDLNTAERDLFDLQEQENQLRMEVGSARQSVQVLDDLRRRRSRQEARKDEVNLQISRYKQLERAFSKDGVPAILIEQALPQIENKANEILDRLSMGGMSVHFSTQAAYKDKHREDMKETLDIRISDSAGVRDYELFSGGEAFRVNFAVRLALSEVLALRAGARLRMLVIDEGFGSQDTQGRQRLVEAINLVQHDFAKILVITHIDELKDAFPVRLEVEKTPRGSMVRVI